MIFYKFSNACGGWSIVHWENWISYSSVACLFFAFCFFFFYDKSYLPFFGIIEVFLISWFCAHLVLFYVIWLERRVRR